MQQSYPRYLYRQKASAQFQYSTGSVHFEYVSIELYIQYFSVRFIVEDEYLKTSRDVGIQGEQIIGLSKDLIFTANCRVLLL